MYKTGDLVRVGDDESGEMLYVGRKGGSQAKVNGQRLELDEIAHHLTSDEAIQHAVALLPGRGPCAKHPVTVLSLRGVACSSENAGMLGPNTRPEACSILRHVQARLRDKVPAYMVPSTWLVLNAIPLLPSGKIDRTCMSKFVEDISEDMLNEITTAQAAADIIPRERTAVSIDDTLKSIWSEVLNIPSQRITPNTSFLHLGGDSISAIHVMARCRALGITVAVQDIVHSKSVQELAHKANLAGEQGQQQQLSAEEDQYDFDLTPIQQLYFQLAGDKELVPLQDRRVPSLTRACCCVFLGTPLVRRILEMHCTR